MAPSSPPSHSTSSSSSPLKGRKRKKERLGWIEWIRGWMYVIHEMLFQRIVASHLVNPLPLPPVIDLTCIVTGSTSGIGREIARQLAEAGAHVVMAVRNVKTANELIQKWQAERAGKVLPLNIEVMFSNVLHKRMPGEAGVRVVCVEPGMVHTNVARDLPKIIKAGFNLIPYFLFTPGEGARSALFAATDPQMSEYCEVLKTKDRPAYAFISQDYRPSSPSEEAHKPEQSHKLWEKTLELVGLPLDAVEKLLQGEEVVCLR